MATVICGSLAFDTIMTFEGRFADQILPDQLHILNVSFLVPTLRRDFGGCAGNIAYSLNALGGTALPMATLGSDGATYLERMRSLGISTEFVRQLDDTFTAQAMIMSDVDNNQITAFHPGAMQQAHITKVAAREDIKLGIVAPDGREAMLQHAEQFAAAGIPFVFDPGQGLPMFDGCEIWTDGEREHVPGVVATEVVEPTGCGDAWRGALLFGLEKGWPLAQCAELGNKVGAIKIAQRGPQNYEIDRKALGV